MYNLFAYQSINDKLENMVILAPCGVSNKVASIATLCIFEEPYKNNF